MTAEFLKVTIERGPNPEQAQRVFDVPAYANQTVLDVVSWVQQNADPTLSYRFACRVGMCGSCAMMVNGIPRWTCRTHISKVLDDNTVTIGPLRNLPVIKDLAVDMDPFFDKWVAAEGVHHGALTRDDPISPVDAASPARVEANAGIECINCSVCYAACDAKDAGRVAILDAVSEKGGCHNCHSMGSCTTYCPNDLDPMSAIAGLKRETAKSFFKRRG